MTIENLNIELSYLKIIILLIVVESIFYPLLLIIFT